ncbi:MAG: PAS/PAC sensor signal transduction histidine kinase [Stygiobacter sp.]|nr:MAG: PAS/PAC sensor signal transduction histidine kinase [Stygiobacter sp.]KAF0217792.1 MAG: PAS/PAC sensor signal transduction histidine [Ignavibacteria bacterium]
MTGEMNLLLSKDDIMPHRKKTAKSKRGHLNILLLEHNDYEAALINSFLKNNGLKFSLKSVKTLKDFTSALHQFNPSIIIADLAMSKFNGLKALIYLRKHDINVPLIVVTKQQIENAAVRCMKEGAADFIINTSLTRLPNSIFNSIKAAERKMQTNISEVRLLMNYELYEHFLKIMGEIDIGLLIVNAETKELIFVNETFCKICRYTVAEIFNFSSLSNLIAGKNRESFEAEMAKILKHNNPINIFNAIILRKDNKKINVEFTARRSFMNNRVLIISIIKEVTETLSKRLMKKLIDEASHENEKRYRSLIEGVKDYAIFMLDSDWRIISWNAGAERIVGYKEKEIILKNFSVFFPKNSEDSIDPIDLLKKARNDKHVETELQLIKKDGNKFWASLTITRLNDKDLIAGTFSIIIRDLTKNKISEELLHEQETQLRSLAKHLQEAREEEKLRIARELHDEFSQMLTVLRMDLTVLSRTISKTISEPIQRNSLLEKISSIAELLESTIRSSRRIITELRPAVLDELGLYTAIQWQAQEFETRTGIRCKIIKLLYDINLDKHTSTAIFRILQEGLTNVAKHSAATNVVINLKVIDHKLLLELKDNGRGIDKNKLRSPTSTGLLGIRERVMALNGSFEIHSDIGDGTRLLIYVPYKQEEKL